ncbi:phosphotransferase [Frankia sp. AiPa1]|uniref:phosphotransferase family protein n=1 Tax=Frankia sp. AiPa1 TaxID=573492 RepID=UPI00202B3389|nr:phosphotransferase [Frankia sp. AiPa1]MCL9761291.1 phosphotransferase family protein [Frankia sp. AiPa1]
MAVPSQLDPELLRARLAAWLADHPPGAGGPAVPPAVRWELGEPETPREQGLSAEMVRVTAYQIGADGERTAWPLMVRFAPGRYRLYPWARFAEECRLVEILAQHTDIPVPPVHGYELDPAVLGAPFLVMGFVDGQVPPDIPPYHMGGFPSDLSLDARARIWDAGLAAMTRLHRLDPAELGLEFIDDVFVSQASAGQAVGGQTVAGGMDGGGVDGKNVAQARAEPGTRTGAQAEPSTQPGPELEPELEPGSASGLGAQLPRQREQGPGPEVPLRGLLGQLDVYEGHLDFFAPADDTAATLRAAFAWLRAHPPAERHPARLLWGDARIGNLIFQDERVAAVLDWEMAALGQPESDLAWYLHLDRHLSEGVGVTRLSGLPDREATVERYAQLLGRPLEDLDRYLLFASVRHTLLAARVTRLVREHGLLPPDQVPPMDLFAADLLARVLDETRAPHATRRPYQARDPYQAPRG